MKTRTHTDIPLRVISTGSDHLREIADALGVPVDAFMTPTQSRVLHTHVLHTDADGTRWLLLCGPQGVPVVRRTGGHPCDQGATEESVSAFLARDQASPQRRALAALIDRLLVAHLAD